MKSWQMQLWKCSQSSKGAVSVRRLASRRLAQNRVRVYIELRRAATRGLLLVAAGTITMGRMMNESDRVCEGIDTIKFEIQSPLFNHDGECEQIDRFIQCEHQ